MPYGAIWHEPTALEANRAHVCLPRKDARHAKNSSSGGRLRQHHAPYRVCHQAGFTIKGNTNPPDHCARHDGIVAGASFLDRRTNPRIPAGSRRYESGIPYTASIEIGEIAQTITDYAKQQHYDMIVMGTRGMGTIGSLLMGSEATKVVHLASVPVTLVK
jgi:hypothetical protein